LDNLIEGTAGLSDKDAQKVLNEIKRNPLHKIFVAVIEADDGLPKVVGTTTLLIEPKFIFRGRRVGHIEDVSVRKGFEKMGIGQKLVLHAITIAKLMDCTKIVLDCSDATMPFYEKIGFSYQDNCMKLFLKDKPQ
jgi:glucosamine-phosphate N-acetyltransferase